MAIDRRRFLGLAGGMLAWAGSGATAAAPARFLSAGYRPALRQFVALAADADGRPVADVLLPGRGHGVIARPGTNGAVAMARRPGRFALAFDTAGPAKPRTFYAPFNRHFQGHAVFDTDGRLLFATENDFARGRGVIGVYDAADGFRRLGELPSHGIGAHELVVMPDARTLAVANGGILTHPDTGRAKLNIPTMTPSLTYVDMTDGRLLDRWAPPPGRRRKLSIRHLAALPDGRVAFACQDQGPAADALALAGLHRPGGAVQPLGASEDQLRGMAGYCGSIAVDAKGQTVAVTAPRGNRVLFWSTASGALTGTMLLADGCGAAAAGPAGRFAVSSGNGAFVSNAPTSGSPATSGVPPKLAWDNHLGRIGHSSGGLGAATSGPSARRRAVP